jgi:hypothetical protein
MNGKLCKNVAAVHMFALTCVTHMILQTYTYLWDAKAKAFLDIKVLLGALTIESQQESMLLHLRPAVPAVVPRKIRFLVD